MTGGQAACRDQTLLWLLDAGALSDLALEGYAAWLGQDERQRCVRFVRAERRRQFIAGRALLRLALGRLLGTGPRDIVLRERPGQAPALASPAPQGAGFSISHSGRWVACAASTVSQLGLDIERIDAGRDLLALAEQALGRDAVSELSALEGQARVDAFYRMWCLHEARFKLGSASAADYVFAQPGLALALSVDRPLALAPSLALVALDELAGIQALPTG
jgi:4'-phosphopantetheinyl transferase